MICNRLEDGIVQLSMAIKFMSLVESITSKFSFFESKNLFWLIVIVIFRYTEIWSNDEGSKNIKLADPKLDYYLYYPEMVLVDVNYCVKP